jgi:hypothetical protein
VEVLVAVGETMVMGQGFGSSACHGRKHARPPRTPASMGGTHDRPADLLAIQLCQPRSASKPNQAMAKEVMVVMCIKNENEANGRWFFGGSH